MRDTEKLTQNEAKILYDIPIYSLSRGVVFSGAATAESFDVYIVFAVLVKKTANNQFITAIFRMIVVLISEFPNQIACIQKGFRFI